MHARRIKVRRLRIALGALAVGTLVATGALGGVATALGWDGLLSPGPSWDDRYTVTSIEATGQLQPDGTLTVVEDIEVTWHEPRRGLIRDIDRDGPAGTLTVSDVEVTSTTQDDVWFEVRRDEVDGHDSVHLGEETEYRPLGTDHYRVTYHVDGLLVADDGRATLRWDTFGDQWDTLIEQATVALDLPAGDHELACVAGAAGQAFVCDGDGPAWHAEQLRPGRGMTVEARLDPEVVDPDGLRPGDLGPLEAFDTLALRRIALILALTAAASLPLLGTVGTPATWRRRERAQQLVETTGPAYIPPAGMRPLTAAMLVGGETGASRDDQLFAAWLLDAQQRELVAVEPTGKGFRVRPIGGRPDSDAELATLRALTAGAGDAGGWATWSSSTSQSRARALEQAWQALRRHHQAQAGVPSSAAARPGLLGGLGLLVGLVAAWQLAELTAPGGIALGAGVLGAWAASTTTDRSLRTAVAGLDEDQLDGWRQVEGLRRFVAEAHADQISGVADDPAIAIDDPFLELLPWVIAFGHGERWARDYDAQIRAATERHAVYAPMRSREIRRVRGAAKPKSSSSSSGSGGRSGVGSGGGGGGGRSR
jgi:uncharacterized membrane protein YgcG